MNRHGELRTGWRILLFAVVTPLIGALLLVPASALLEGRAFVGVILAIVAVLAGSYLMTRFVNRKPFGAIGLWPGRRSWRDFVLGTAVGILTMASIFAVMLVFGLVTVERSSADAASAFRSLAYIGALFFFAAVLEELLFRGYAFQTLMQGVTFLPAALITAVFFALAHMMNPNVTVLSLINIGLAAMWLSFAYLSSRMLWLPFGLHFGWNFAQSGLFGFPTSGLVFDRPVFLQSTSVGPAWLTGGNFGPEGGVLATCALILCTWFVVKIQAARPPHAVVTLDSIEDLLEAPVPDKEGTA